jgi:hypothetical protein
MVGQGARSVTGAVAGGEAGLTALHARVAGRFARLEVRARALRRDCAHISAGRGSRVGAAERSACGRRRV